MKKVFSFILAVVMIFSFAACGSKDEETLPLYSQGLTKDGVYDVKALDYVTLPELDGVEFEEGFYEVSDEEVDTQMYNILSQYATYNEITNRNIVAGDRVNIDYSGSVDGELFDGGTATGQDVIAGSNQFIDDFLFQIIGHLPGDEFNVEVTFPEDYGKEELNGKDAVFAVKINHIKEEVPVELTDDFVKEHFKEQLGLSTVDDMQKYVYDNLLEQNRVTMISNYLCDNAVVSAIPEVAIEHQINNIKMNYTDQAAQYGVDLDTFIQYAGGESFDALLEQSYDQIEVMAKQALTYQAVAETVGIKVANTDVADYFEAIDGNRDYSGYQSHFGLPYLKYAVMTYQVNHYLMDHAAPAPEK